MLPQPQPPTTILNRLQFGAIAAGFGLIIGAVVAFCLSAALFMLRSKGTNGAGLTVALFTAAYFFAAGFYYLDGAADLVVEGVLAVGIVILGVLSAGYAVDSFAHEKTRKDAHESPKPPSLLWFIIYVFVVAGIYWHKF